VRRGQVRRGVVGEQPPWWKPIPNFASRTIVGSIAFALVALATTYLFVIVRLVERSGVSHFVVGVLTYLEYGLVISDAVFFTGWIVRDIWKVLRGKLE
jgi:hypothetical protein